MLMIYLFTFAMTRSVGHVPKRPQIRVSTSEKASFHQHSLGATNSLGVASKEDKLCCKAEWTVVHWSMSSWYLSSIANKKKQVSVEVQVAPGEAYFNSKTSIKTKFRSSRCSIFVRNFLLQILDVPTLLILFSVLNLLLLSIWINCSTK